MVLAEMGDLVDIINDHDFSIYDEGDGRYLFSKFSPEGQDFSFTISTGDSIDDFLSNIKEKYENFDVSYETYLWLDNCGHGKNGAPYDMKDLYEDMNCCHGYILELYDIVHGVKKIQELRSEING